MSRALCIFIIASLASLAALFLSSGIASPIFDQPIAVVLSMAAMIAALSVGFHAFIDSVTKDLPDKTKLPNPSALNEAVTKLGDLRKEILANAVLVFFMLIASALLYGLEKMFIASFAVPEYTLWFLISLRFGCLTIIVVAAYTQLRGFITATMLRDVLARYR